MLSYPEFYRMWWQRVAIQTGERCRTRRANLAWLIVGIYFARSVSLNRIAGKIRLSAKKLSVVKRLQRFLANPAVRPRDLYQPVATSILQSARRQGELHLIIDSTKVGARRRLVMVAVAYRRRAIPVAWTWVNSPVGHTTTHIQLALLSYVRQLLPPWTPVSLVGDTEFGSAALLRVLDGWGWTYALRQRPQQVFMPMRMPLERYRLDQQGIEPGELMWLGDVELSRRHATHTHLVWYWKRGEKRPWYLATNGVSPHQAIRLYRRRMWIEALFRDLKRQGFDLEHSRLGTFQRLSRLVLAVCLLYVWLVTVGERVLERRLAVWVDRTDRRDLSVFRLGWDYIERCLLHNDDIPIAAIPHFAPLPIVDRSPSQRFAHLFSVR